MHYSDAMERSSINDCFRHDGGRLSHDAAIDLLKARLGPVAGVSTVATGQALGRILAEPVVAGCNVPPHTNAAVDGFAVCSGDYDGTVGGRFRITGRSAAGAPFDGAVGRGEAVRILTGAVVPEGLDIVAMQEDCEVTGDGEDAHVTLPGGLETGVNIRRAGEDVRVGDQLLEAGHILRPQDLAALSSIGLDRVSCRERLRIGIVSTGDEVVRPGAQEKGLLDGGQGVVFDANQPMLAALGAQLGADVIDAGIWRDDRQVVIDGLERLAQRCDVILTSGGASRGDEDYMVAALDVLGRRHFWQLSIKPGRPLMLGQIGSTVVVGLPGNPVAVFVCFLVYVWPMLRVLAGAGWREAGRMPARAQFGFANRKRGRREFWRGMVRVDDGGLVVDKFKRDGSGLISGLRAANCLIEIPEDAGDVQVGDMVRVIPFSEFGIASA